MERTNGRNQFHKGTNLSSSLTFSGVSDLAGERQSATFDARSLTLYLDGSEEMTEHREKIMLEFERDPTFRLDDIHDLTRPQLRERYMTRVL